MIYLRFCTAPASSLVAGGVVAGLVCLLTGGTMLTLIVHGLSVQGRIPYSKEKELNVTR